MKRIIFTLGCFCLVALNPVYTQATNGVKTEQVEEKMHACCKAKGGPEFCCMKGMVTKKVEENVPACCKAKGGSDQCCKKGLATKEVKSQCNTKNCDKPCCKNKGASFEKKSWWKFW